MNRPTMKKLVFILIVAVIGVSACTSEQYVAHTQKPSATFKGKNPKAAYKSAYKKRKGKKAVVVALVPKKKKHMPKYR